jgi:hypothetical protein
VRPHFKEQCASAAPDHTIILLQALARGQRDLILHHHGARPGPLQSPINNVEKL